MYVPIQVASHYSLQLATSKGWQVAARVRQLGLAACAITDYDTLAGVPSFLLGMKAACGHCGFQGGKDGKPNQHADGGKGRCTLAGVACPGFLEMPLKPLLGCRFSAALSFAEDSPASHVTVIAKNLAGWKGLIRASSESNRPGNRRPAGPCLGLDLLAAFSGGDWLAFSGGPRSTLGDFCFADPAAAYSATSYAAAKALAKPWAELEKGLPELAERHAAAFGRDSFLLSVCAADAANTPAADILAKLMRWLGQKTGLPCVAACDAHYPDSGDARDQRVLLCAKLKTSLAAAHRKFATPEGAALEPFFRSGRYHLPSPAEMALLHPPEELAATLALADRCEAYDILVPPRMPSFECPGGKDPAEFFTEQLRAGWAEKVQHKVPRGEQPKYAARVKEEIAALAGVGLAPYFLVVQDFCRFAYDTLKAKKSRGRGSAAGSIAAWLLDIHDTDPVKYDLLFERFFSSSRYAPEHVSFEESPFI